MATITDVEVGIPGPSGPPSLSAGALVTTAGDLIRGSATNVAERYAVGANRKTLRVTGGLPVWSSGIGPGRLIAANNSETAVKDLADYVCDATNDETEIQAANDAVAPLGGEVVLAPGTFLAKGLLLDSLVTLRGAGAEATILRMPNSANATLIHTRDFATLTGTDSNLGQHHFRLCDMTLDGNKVNNAGSSSYGMRIYGFAFALERLVFRDFNNDNLWSEWGSDSGAFTGAPVNWTAMEARLNEITSMRSNGSGVTWKGPHDTQAVNVFPIGNAGYGIHILGQGHGFAAVNLHPWGVGQDWGTVVEASGCQFANCYFEGGEVGQLWLKPGSDGAIIVGGRVNATAGYTSQYGIRVGEAGVGSVADYMIVTQAFDCIHGPVWFDNDGGGYVRVSCHQASGTAYAGSPSGGTDYEFQSNNTITNRGAQHKHHHSFNAADLVVHRKAGVPTDADMETAENGGIILDETNGRLYLRSGGAWRYAALT